MLQEWESTAADRIDLTRHRYTIQSIAPAKNRTMIKLHPTLFCLFVALGTGGMPGLLTATGLVSPIDVEARRTLVGRSLGEAACPAVVAPVHDILAQSFYTDPQRSIVDPARLAARDKAVKPLHDFSEGIARLADRWVEAHPPQPEAATCALAWLDAWARKDAMLGEITNQGGYERKWTFGGIALAYLKIRDAPGLDPAAKARVEAWLGRLTAAVSKDISDKINNHLYWAALAVAASAVATDDRAAFAWAMDKYRFALTQIAPDGTLPLELARGQRALHYHLFAVTPLVMLAEIGAANGLDLYGERDGALGRLVSVVLAGLANPTDFARRSGTAQEPEHLSGWSVAWAEIWYARTRDKNLLPLLQRYRPMRNNWLGGNVTLAFGVSELPAP
jgi:poly(beta-D-mannuronate) lyase